MAGRNGPDPNGPNVPRAGLYPGENSGPIRGPRLDPYDLARQTKFNNPLTRRINDIVQGDILKRRDNKLVFFPGDDRGFEFVIVEKIDTEKDTVLLKGWRNHDITPMDIMTDISTYRESRGVYNIFGFEMTAPYDTRRFREKVNKNEQRNQKAIEKSKEETRIMQAGIIEEINKAISEKKELPVEFPYRFGEGYYQTVKGIITNIDTSHDPVTVTVKTVGMGDVTVSLNDIKIIHEGGKRKEKKSRKNRKRKNSRRTRNKT